MTIYNIETVLQTKIEAAFKRGDDKSAAELVKALAAIKNTINIEKTLESIALALQQAAALHMETAKQ